MKFLLSFFLISLSFSAFSETKDFSQENLTMTYEESKTVSQSQYMGGGGVASILLGWGRN